MGLFQPQQPALLLQVWDSLFFWEIPVGRSIRYESGARCRNAEFSENFYNMLKMAGKSSVRKTGLFKYSASRTVSLE